MKTRKKLYVPYVCSVTYTFSGIMQGDGVVTTTPTMIVDKGRKPFEEALANHQIRDLEVTTKLNLLEEAKQLVKKSKKEY